MTFFKAKHEVASKELIQKDFLVNKLTNEKRDAQRKVEQLELQVFQMQEELCKVQSSEDEQSLLCTSITPENMTQMIDP